MIKRKIGVWWSVFVLTAAVGYAAVQSERDSPARANQDQQSVIRQQLADMIQRAIEQSTFPMPGGGKAMTVPLLSTQDYEKAKRFGDGGTVCLAEYLKSKQFFEQLLAIRLLAQIGSDASKDVLDDFAEKAELIATRSYALDFVAAGGRAKDIALLEKMAASDVNAHVRTRAIDVLQQFKKERSQLITSH